tara:strand:- start:575 stop:1171 length:597 start_codon:yes stop_codon:yes gene_type:complete
MIEECFPFIKYVYVAILFVFVFLFLFNQNLTMIGFGSLFGLQTIFTIMICFDIFMDNDRGIKSLIMQVPQTTYTQSYTIKLPIWFIIIPTVIIQFVSSLMMLMTYVFLNKNKKKVVVSSANERKIDNYKIISVALTYVIIALLYAYFTHYLNESSAVNFSAPYKLFIFLLCFVVIKLAIFNLLFANDLSKLRHKSTSG